MGENKKVDIAIHGDMDIVVKGLPQEKLKETVEGMRRTGTHNVRIGVKEIESIEVLNPDGTVDQTIFGGKNKL